MDLAPCVIEPRGAANACVIWLHGLGADANDFVDMPKQLLFEDAMQVRFVFPNAPYRPVRCAGGQRMRAWYDIADLTSLAEEDAPGIDASVTALNALIDRQGLPDSRVVVCGFSQGGAIALRCALGRPTLAGVIGLSTYLPLMASTELSSQPLSTLKVDQPVMPALLCHGLYDPLLPLTLAERTRDALLDGGLSVAFHTYPMAHTVCDAEIATLSAFLARCYGDA